MERSINLTSVGNARQLGGYEIDGKKIKKDKLFRTASLYCLSAEDISALQNTYRVATVVDLRMTSEQKAAPDPEIPGAANIFLPVLEMTDYPQYNEETAKILTDPTKDRFEILKISYEMGALSDRLYETFLFCDRGKAAYRAFFKYLLNLPGDNAILWHCTDGKDRTGVAAMLLLTALGADRETILSDYMATNDYNAEKIAKARAGIEHAPISPELKEVALFGAGAVFEKFMLNAMNGMDDRYGSAKAYLKQELGIGAPECAELQNLFLE